MADKNAKIAGQAPGRWYVDASCIGCSLCTTTDPDVFEMQGDVALVIAQPAGADAESLAAQAMSECPAQAIGNDA